MTDPLYTVYFLAVKDKCWRVRCVGLTKQRLSKRLHGHLWDAKRPYRKEHKTNWIRKCIAANLPIRIHAVRCNLLLDDACRLERELIARYRPRLVNIHEGGNSGYTGLPEDAKKRHRENTRSALLKIPKELRRAIIDKALAGAALACEKRRAARMAGWTHFEHLLRFAVSPDGRHVSLQMPNGWYRCGSERTIRSKLAKAIWNATKVE
jgi:hypothetical protein